MTRDWDALIDEEYLGLHVRHPRRHREQDEPERECEAVESADMQDVDERDFR